MSARAVALILLAGAFAGCAGGEGAGNPNLLTPKLVVHQRPDGNMSVYVHGGFREQLYDWIAIRVDNETLSNRSWVFSAEHEVASTGFYVEAEAAVGDVMFLGRARVDLNETTERPRASVSILDAEGWDDPRSYSLPYELYLDRPRSGGDPE